MNSSPEFRLLSRQFPTASEVLRKIASIEAKLTLARPVTHVISDIHGEHKKLRHVINNASGEMRVIIDRIFEGELTEADKSELLGFLYYPVEKFQQYRSRFLDKDARLELTKRILRQQFQIVRHSAPTVSHSKLLSLLDRNFRTLFLALLDEIAFKRGPSYVDSMVVALGEYDQDVTAVHMASRLVRNLAIPDIIVAGDLADRGERADEVIHFLEAQPKVEITWGNHDVIWMGATLGSEVLIATVLRVSLRYLRMWQLEEGYGILLSPLVLLAKTAYDGDPAEVFLPKRSSEFSDERLIARMHKAIAIIEFKLSGQLIERHPEWKMEARCQLHQIDHEEGTITLNGKVYDLIDSHFPTIDPENPYELSEAEKVCVGRLKESFISSKRLWRHMLFVVKNGSMFLRRDQVLIFHACVPSYEDGSFREPEINGQQYGGRKLYEKLEDIIRGSYRQGAAGVSDDLDYYYWMWASGESPLFGRDQMTTFERYFIRDKATHAEREDPYFDLIHDRDYCKKIGAEFEMEEDVMIVNGHVPVKIEKGEDPVKRGGNAVTIDGAFSEAYGDHGYTLMLRPDGIDLAEHSHFESVDHFLSSDEDMQPKLRRLADYSEKRLIADTQEGLLLKEELGVLNALLGAYRAGDLKERYP